jgi:hypothetical protein
MALNIELFTSVIMDNVFPNDTFMTRGTDHSQYVKYLMGDGKTAGAAIVHIPQAGAVPIVAMNRSLFPASAIARTDTDLTYSINEYSCNPFYLEYSEAETVAYDKAASLLYNMTQVLKQTIGNQTAYAWAPSGTTTAGVTRIVRTSGPSGSTALSSGATGTRNSLALADIANAKNILDQDFAIDSMRSLVLPSALWNIDILQLSNITKFLELGDKSGLREGTIDPQTIEGYVGKIYGFDVFTRPSVVVYQLTATTGTTVIQGLAPIGANGVPVSAATSDELGAIFFQQNGVSNAIGETIIFWNPDRAEYYGSLMSALVRQGAAKMRADGKFVGAIVQQ